MIEIYKKKRLKYLTQFKDLKTKCEKKRHIVYKFNCKTAAKRLFLACNSHTVVAFLHFNFNFFLSFEYEHFLVVFRAIAQDTSFPIYIF